MERNRRAGKEKPVLIGEDGVYRCVVVGCPHAGTTHYTNFKNHLATHSRVELEGRGYSLEVSLSFD